MADKEEFAHMRDDGSMRENDDDDVTASDESEEETDLDETYEPDELPVSFRADSRADSRAHNKRGKKVWRLIPRSHLSPGSKLPKLSTK